MSVRKFRSVVDMPTPTPAGSVHDGLANACAMSEASQIFGNRTRAPRGVRRFRSVEEADAHRRRWEAGARDDRSSSEGRKRRD